MNTTQANRLLNAAFALRQAGELELHFDMCSYCDEDCGTPHCVLGHYAARKDLQNAFFLGKKTYGARSAYEFCSIKSDYALDLADDEVLEHFGISQAEAESLFDLDGCGAAGTPNEAADYIENFVRGKGFEVQ